MNLKIKKQHGFSLVEVCIACGIIVVFLVPVFKMMTKSSAGTIRNRNEILAQQYASDIIAYCNVTAFDDDFLKQTDSKIPEYTRINGDNFVIELDISDEGFKKIATRTVSIKDFKAGSDFAPWPYDYKIVTVKVEWQQPGEPFTRNVTVTGLISNIAHDEIL